MLSLPSPVVKTKQTYIYVDTFSKRTICSLILILMRTLKYKFLFASTKEMFSILQFITIFSETWKQILTS